MSKNDEDILIIEAGKTEKQYWYDLWKYRELFYFLSWKEIKLRYKQTIFGILWAIIQPFFTMIVFTVIFGNLANMPSDSIPYPIFVYSGLLLWNIFSTSLNNASQSLVNSANIIQKIYFPKIILLASSIIVSLIDFLFAALIFVFIMLYFNFLPHFEGLLILPVSLLLTVFSSFGLGLFLSAFNVKYRDVRYILPFFLQLLIFVTPVIYPTSIVPRSYQWILALNPMTGAIEIFRSSFLGTASINWTTLLISAGASMTFVIFGLLYFLKTEKNFADVI
jgi:lipopolysaccharide transport system permease protein